MTEKKTEVTKKGSRMKAVKTIIRFAVGGLVEIFVGAVTNNVVGGVEGSKIAKLGAKAGGFLVGMYIGDQVSEHISDQIASAMDELDALKAKIEEEEG